MILCCKDCVPPKRYPGCHSKCEVYIRERKAYEDLKAVVAREKRNESDYYAYKVERIIKTSRRSRKNEQ